MTKTQKKRKLRLKYPKKDHPKLDIGGVTFRIVDISQSGCKFMTKDQFAPKPRELFTVRIHFFGHKTYETKGVIIRYVGDLFAMEFRNKIPAQILMDEYDRLTETYGTAIFK